MEQVHSEASELSAAQPSQSQTEARRPCLRKTIRKMDKRVRGYRNLLSTWTNEAHAWMDNCQVRVDQLHLVMKLHESWARLVGLPTTFGEGLAAEAWARDHGLPTLLCDALAPAAAAARPEPDGCLCIHGSPALEVDGVGWCPWCLPHGTRYCCLVRPSSLESVPVVGGGVPGVSL